MLVVLSGGPTSGLAGSQSALLGGVVQSDATPAQPIRRAIVTLTGPELSMNLSTVTDDRGRFLFERLSPGTYTITASKAAYLSTVYGAKAPGRPGSPLALTAGDRVTDIRLTLVRGAVLTGTLRDYAGMPAPNVHITVVPAGEASGVSTYSAPPEGPILTDDRGVYRAYGLAPGEYVIAATPRSAATGPTLRLPPGTIDAALRELQARQSGRSTSTPPAPPPPRPVTGGPVFYPGTPVGGDAMRIRVAPGEVREGLDFGLDLAPVATVEGRVVMGDGSAIPGVQLTLTPIGPPLPEFSEFRLTLRQSPDGTFSYSNVIPGRYVLFVRGVPGTPPVSVGEGRGGSPRGGGGPGPGVLWAMAEFGVSGGDVGGITLVLRPGLNVAGRVVFDATSLKPPGNLTAIRVRLMRLKGTMAPQVPASASLRADATFAIGGVFPGSYSVAAFLPDESGWWLRSAMLDGRDLLDTPLELGAGATDVTDLVLTFSDRRSELSGALRTGSGEAAADHVVIVLPVDRALWQSERRVRATRPASDGRFTFADLPAGDYLLAAATDIESDTWRQPAFLEQVAASSVKVRVADGVRVTQDLQIR